MKKLIKKILKEENGLDWVNEVDPLNHYSDYIDSIEAYKPKYLEEIGTIKEVHRALTNLRDNTTRLLDNEGDDVTIVSIMNVARYLEDYSQYVSIYYNFVVKYSNMVDITVEQALEIFEEYFTNKLDSVL